MKEGRKKKRKEGKRKRKKMKRERKKAKQARKILFSPFAKRRETLEVSANNVIN